MKSPRRHLLVRVALLCAVAALPGIAAAKPASSIPAAALIEPADLAASLKESRLPRPLLLHVGFRALYVQGHIPGSEYAGPTGQDRGLALLRDRVAKLPKDATIVLYCGCCPWSRCPNVAAAYDALHGLGFSNLKVLHIADDFGTNWADKGYPVATGD